MDTGVTRPSGVHGQGTVMNPQLNQWYFGGSFWLGAPWTLDIVHPVHPLATTLFMDERADPGQK